MKENQRERISFYGTIGFCALGFLMYVIALFCPIISGTVDSISPFEFAVSRTAESLVLDGLEPLVVSYYVSKVFYILFALLPLAMGIVLVYLHITRHKGCGKFSTAFLFALMLLTLVSSMIGLNYASIYRLVSSFSNVSSFGMAYFIPVLLLLIGKYVFDVLFNKSYLIDEIKNSNEALASVFAQFVLVLATLITPIYIFPGTPYRMRGIDILTGGEDVLEFLPLTGTYKVIIAMFTLLMLASFGVCVALYFLRRRIFIHYIKPHSVVGICSILTYGLMGLNYMVVYVDGRAYETFFNSSMNTYSYIPLILLVLFYLGFNLRGMAAELTKVEYNVISRPQFSDSRGGFAASSGTAAANDEDVVADPIPAFSELDRRAGEFKDDFEWRMVRRFPNPTLPAIVNHVIEYAKHSPERLSYGQEEIKTFVAGLAASKLSILQGMSGTGKTSLPKIFMEAIDSECEIVAVESSWRDKNELLGYYNGFTKRYTPKSFTQYLYKAALNRDIPYFIVLDEMNLSRIEYYFSDFLSLMEAREGKRSIKLFDVQLYPQIDERTQYLRLRDGHTIDVPPNVWFVGTANRDESTFEISDKVYDRAQTMNFMRRAPKAKLASTSELEPKFLPYSELRSLLEQTKQLEFDAESNSTILRAEQLLRPYNISFGNRILKQMEDFVKAYVACSITSSSADIARYTHEAVDKILLTKVLRKLELKQINDLKSLADSFAPLRLPCCEEFLNSLILES